MARSVIGIDKHNARLSRMLSAAAQKKIGAVVYAGADKVRVEARRLIADGAIQGKGHKPSAPGEAPNWDTGDLANGITTRKTGAMQAETASESPHSDPLENGTSKLAARPFMSPATNNVRKAVVADVTSQIDRIIRS